MSMVSFIQTPCARPCGGVKHTFPSKCSPFSSGDKSHGDTALCSLWSDSVCLLSFFLFLREAVLGDTVQVVNLRLRDTSDWLKVTQLMNGTGMESPVPVPPSCTSTHPRSGKQLLWASTWPLAPGLVTCHLSVLPPLFPSCPSSSSPSLLPLPAPLPSPPSP